MLELYIIRHGLSDESIMDEALDEMRPLEKKGREQMKAVGKSLKGLNVCFDRVLTSPLIRAKESAEIINAYCGTSQKAIDTDLLMPGSSFQKLSKFLNELEMHTIVAIVGHEPFLSEYASYCLSKSKSSFIHLRKGGVLKLEIDKMITPGQCRLAWLMEPRLMGQHG